MKIANCKFGTAPYLPSDPKQPRKSTQIYTSAAITFTCSHGNILREEIYKLDCLGVFKGDTDAWRANMEETEKQLSGNSEGNSRRSYWWVVGVGCLAVVLLGILLPRGDHSKSRQSGSTNQLAANANGSSGTSSGERARLHHTRSGPSASAEEIVATKLSQFGRNRRDVMRGMAKRFNVEVRPDVERFFDAVERGKWDEIEAAFQPLFEQRKAGTRDDLNNIWGQFWRRMA